MNKTVQALVAVASIAIIVFVGAFFWSKAEQTKANQQAQRAASVRLEDARLADCKDVVSAYDRGLVTYAKAHSPRDFDIYLRACRDLIMIDQSR